jgi:hypothetical protein
MQQWMHERASVLRHWYIACLVNGAGSYRFHIRTRNRASISSKGKTLILQSVEYGSGARTALYEIGTASSYHGGKATGA